MSEWTERRSAIQKKWREDNPEKMKEYRERRKEDPETREHDAQMQKEWYNNNREKRNAYMREYMRRKRAQKA